MFFPIINYQEEWLMRSTKEAGCFPYGSNTVCFMEVSANGEIKQLTNHTVKRNAYMNALSGTSKIYAVWPGRWRSDLFIIDDLAAFCIAQQL